MYIKSMTSNSTTVRISLELHELLKSLAEQSEVSMQEILHEALERYRRERFLQGLNQDFSQSSEYADEIAELDGTVADGLEGY